MLLDMGISGSNRPLNKIIQTAYVNSFLKKHGLEGANPVSMPFNLNIKLDLDSNELNDPEMKEESPEQASASYTMLIELLMYLAIRM